MVSKFLKILSGYVERISYLKWNERKLKDNNLTRVYISVLNSLFGIYVDKNQLLMSKMGKLLF